jgi:hypothetical protein
MFSDGEQAVLCVIVEMKEVVGGVKCWQADRRKYKNAII